MIRTLEKTHLQNKGPRVKLVIAYRTHFVYYKTPTRFSHSRLGKSSNAWGKNRLEDARSIDPATSLAC